MVLLRAIPCGGAVPIPILGCVFIGYGSIVEGCIKNKEHKKTTDGGDQLFNERESIIQGVLEVASLQLTNMLWNIFVFLIQE